MDAVDVVFIQLQMLLQNVFDVRGGGHALPADLLDDLQYLALGFDADIGC